MFKYRYEVNGDWVYAEAASGRVMNDRLVSMDLDPIEAKLQTTNDTSGNWVNCNIDSYITDSSGIQVKSPEGTVYKSISLAARCSSISYATLYRWLAAGDRGWVYTQS